MFAFLFCSTTNSVSHLPIKFFIAGERFVDNTLPTLLYSERCFSPMLLLLLLCSAPLPPQPEVDTFETTTDSITVTWTYNSYQTYVEAWKVTATPIFPDYSGIDTLSDVISDEAVVNVFDEPLISGGAFSRDVETVVTPLISGVTYFIDVQAMVGNISSDMSSINATVSKYQFFI